MRLFRARGEERQRVFAAADRLRREVYGDEVTYVVTRNIQYTNVCYFRCGFCAFSKGKLAANLRGAPYLVPLDEIVRRAREAWERGATEVCLQGGIHPAFTGDYYASVVEAIRDELPGAARPRVLARSRSGRARRRSGCRSTTTSRGCARSASARCPGTAAEILDDEVRAVICPDKVTTEQWLAVHAAAHGVGLRSNVTIMFGHVERPVHWARHLLRAREQQRGRAASPSSCRCRSCTWRRRCGCRAGRARARRSARRCSCTRSRGSRSTRRSRTSRRRG